MRQTLDAPTVVDSRRTVVESSGNRLLQELGRWGLLIVLLAVVITFSLMKPESFFVWGNFRGTFDQQSIILMVALGAMIPLIIGEFDLSVGANAGFAGIVCVGLCEKSQVDPVLALVIGTLTAGLIGLLNGLMVVKLKLNSFVATLGTATILAGLGPAYTGGTDLLNPPQQLTDIGRHVVVFGLPTPVLVALVTAVVLYVVLQRLPFGRELLAVGVNRRAAELTGIRPERKILLSFTLGGLVAGVGGVLYSAELGSGSLNLGPTLLLPAFAAAFLGATAITPGRFNVGGTIVAVLLLALTVSGLQQLGFDPWIQSVLQGLALIVAVTMSTFVTDLRLARLRSAQLELLAAGRHDEQVAAPANPGSIAPTT